VVATYDVAARLAEGRGALDIAQTYVSASRLRGYDHPDLTRYAGQLLDWFGSLSGLDLEALDTDCRMLGTAAQRSETALAEMQSVVAGLPADWRGQGATAAAEFLAENCDTARHLVDALQASQTCCATLRDELWHLVDRTVSATLSIAEQGRPEWRTAAEAVLAGDPSRADAGQIVDSQVKPFVDSVIRGDWLSAMQSVGDAADAAYRTAITRIGALGGRVFEAPRSLGPRYAAPALRESVARVGEASSVLRENSGAPDGLDVVPDFPAAASGRPTASAAVPPSTAMSPAPPNPWDALASGMPQPPAMTPFGPGLPAAGFPGLSDLGSTGSGALPGSSSEPLDIPALDVPRLGGSDEVAAVDDEPGGTSLGEAENAMSATDGDDAEDAESGTDADTETDGEAGNAEDADSLVGEPDPNPESPETAVEATDDPAPVADCPQPETAGDPAPPAPVEGPVDPEPPVAAETPCEIAADELPQVGE
jgi:uncharacterized protein YukE